MSLSTRSRYGKLQNTSADGVFIRPISVPKKSSRVVPSVPAGLKKASSCQVLAQQRHNDASRSATSSERTAVRPRAATDSVPSSPSRSNSSVSLQSSQSGSVSSRSSQRQNNATRPNRTMQQSTDQLTISQTSRLANSSNSDSVYRSGTTDKTNKRKHCYQSQLIKPDTRNIPQSNAHRISVNSDLLSRVEKEKKQYEARISELTQLAETRKIEIAKLQFENRRVREELTDSKATALETYQEAEALRCQLSSLEKFTSANDEVPADISSVDLANHPIVDLLTMPTSNSSPTESLDTTARLTPGAVSSAATRLPPSTLSSEDCPMACLGDLAISLSRPVVSKDVNSITTLHGRLLQMEEANYTTTEELQATLQELWDLQRNVDQAQEETRSLAFEREILLEALSTQTEKLEHCRFQIELLKYLLQHSGVTSSGDANDEAVCREERFRELYASVEQEKQVLLCQNQELAQSSDSLAKECIILTEKASQLQDAYDLLQVNFGSLDRKYKAAISERAVSYLDSLPTSGGVSSAPVSPCKTCTGGKSEVDRLRERLELATAEHDRQVTEWRLYESDLLKAVSVADNIRLEADANSEMLHSQIYAMKEELEKHAKESAIYRQEVDQLKQTVDRLTSPSKPTSAPAKAVDDSSSRPTPQPSTNSTRLTLASPHLHHVLSSPGGPGRPSAVTNGPIVRNLIQSIESKVKVVQHQKRGLSGSKSQIYSRPASSSATTGHLSSSTPSSPIDSSTTSMAPGGPPLLGLRRLSTCQQSVDSDKGSITNQVTATASADKRSTSLRRNNSTFAMPSSSPSTPTINATNNNTTVMSGSRDSMPIDPSPHGADTSTLEAAPPPTVIDPLQELVRRMAAGSKRNALLQWCQARIQAYSSHVSVSNFSSSWNNGLAFCALLHSYMPEKIPWHDLIASSKANDKRRCFEVAFAAAESVGITTSLDLQYMLTTHRPDWSSVMAYIVSVYKHYEVKSD